MQTKIWIVCSRTKLCVGVVKVQHDDAIILRDSVIIFLSEHSC